MSSGFNNGHYPSWHASQKASASGSVEYRQPSVISTTILPIPVAYNTVPSSQPRYVKQTMNLLTNLVSLSMSHDIVNVLIVVKDLRFQAAIRDVVKGTKFEKVVRGIVLDSRSSSAAGWDVYARVEMRRKWLKSKF